MAKPSTFHTEPLGLAALGLGPACLLFKFGRALAGGVLETACGTTACVLPAAAVLSASYAVFLLSWRAQPEA